MAWLFDGHAHCITSNSPSKHQQRLSDKPENIQARTTGEAMVIASHDQRSWHAPVGARYVIAGPTMVPPMGAAGLMPSAAVSAPLGPKQDIGEEGGWDLYLLGAKMASARPAAASLIDAVHIPHESTA